MVATVKKNFLVLSSGEEIPVPGVTSWEDAFFWVSKVLSENLQKVKEEHKKIGGRGAPEGGIPPWRLKERHIGTLQKVLADQNFLHQTSASVTSVTAAPKPKVVNEVDVVLAKVQELGNATKSVRKEEIEDFAKRKVLEIQRSCVESGVDEWDLHYFKRVVHACLEVHDKKGLPWKQASTFMLGALAPSFAHIMLHKLTKRAFYFADDHEHGLTTLHNIMRIAKTGPFNVEALEEAFAEGGHTHSRWSQMSFFDLLPKEVQKEHDMFIWAVKMHPPMIHLHEDPGMVKCALEANPEALEYADEAYHGELCWVQLLLSKKPNFDLRLLKGGGEVVSEILDGARKFPCVSVAEFALSRPRKVLVISSLVPAGDVEARYVNLCVSTVGGDTLWSTDHDVPVTFTWKTTQGFRQWWSDCRGDQVSDYAIITPEGGEGKMGEEVPLIDFTLDKWASLQHLVRVRKLNANFGSKMKAKKEKKKGQDEGNDGDNTA